MDSRGNCKDQEKLNKFRNSLSSYISTEKSIPDGWYVFAMFKGDHVDPSHIVGKQERKEHFLPVWEYCW